MLGYSADVIYKE